MWLSFLRKINKYKQYIQSIDDIPTYVKMNNREIQLDIITPQIAETIDSLIRFWNLYDDESAISLGAREPIKIYINSLGGSLDAAITIMNSIKISRTPVYTFNIGNVYKESFLIYLAGHKRYTYQDAIFMYTDTMLPTITEEGDNESTFYSKNAAMDVLIQNIKAFFLEKVSITETQYDKHCKNEWWFSADDAIKIHIANEISRSHYYFIAKKD